MSIDDIAARFLGKNVVLSGFYDPSLIVPIPRIDNRKKYNIDDDKLPFKGFDVWHAYEFSVLTENGVPITRVLKIKYNCDSKFIVESKSLKLYLNSFNMSKFGKTIPECLNICKNLIEKDLSDKLLVKVQANFLENVSDRVEIFEDFENISEYINQNDIVITEYNEAPQILQVQNSNSISSYYLKFDSLRSNCRVTHQPDFGDVFIYYKSQKHICEKSLFKYLCSFRSEYHFHEECCEMIFKRLLDLLDKEDDLFVCALYTRRGGIDICPIRYNFETNLADNLINLNKFARCGIKQ